MVKKIEKIKENAGVLRASFKKGGKSYKQIDRTSMVAMYEVREGSSIYYEVFKIKKKKSKKVQLSGGFLEVEEGEAYPSLKHFGNLAYCCKTIEVARDRFDQIVYKLASRKGI
jgi:hypothetical protein